MPAMRTYDSGLYRYPYLIRRSRVIAGYFTARGYARERLVPGHIYVIGVVLSGSMADGHGLMLIKRAKGRYLLRLRPYKSGDSRIDGVVIALFDLDASNQ
jgi:hypothetical protein